ncbi:hypothetical protein HBH79_095590 [Parastagonospora nodorum]|nr:hypothetical protein HBH51_245900 [Parastagonospora nodorum]KAH4164346.1 hypothetical protein HBH44_073900 [Parastagonospora nodorum]KAH4329626.1 hypothetical protein HBI00_092840 [Parastagonospora nodorum]KAH4366233.1 hypothetical protein HBH94_148970 [Parastagonospora nodorum]KAH4569896.1 hypothetical protein HBH84_119630 [Parastagonospora nodorum]
MATRPVVHTSQQISGLAPTSDLDTIPAYQAVPQAFVALFSLLFPPLNTSAIFHEPALQTLVTCQTDAHLTQY